MDKFFEGGIVDQPASNPCADAFIEAPTLTILMPRQELLNYVLKFSNALRERLDGSRLNSLQKSQPRSSSSCLIANSLNFNCRINPSGNIGSNSIAYAYFGQKFQAEAYRQTAIGFEGANKEGLYKVETYDRYSVSSTNWIHAELPFRVRLTEHLNISAVLFDKGYFPEYDSYQEAALKLNNEYIANSEPVLNNG